MLSVSEVAMESSPGPSTSSSSRPESDYRAQSSSANAPRAGTCMGTHRKKKNLCSQFHNLLSHLYKSGSSGIQCIPQRAALLKSMLNFLKKAIQDPAFSDGIRHGELFFPT